MDISKLQKWVKEDWEFRSKEQPTLELQLLFLMEEIGEIAEAIRKSKGSKERVNKNVDIGSEISDAIICLCTIANHFNLNIEEEIIKFKDRVKSRHEQGF